jgi:beta-phosphoglucomutase-like phosphatase (HAD superfamily)
MFEAAVFDWDGTLADTRTVIVASFQKALSEVG